jgi:nucleotide-binding universal stress UspA family protein
LPFLRRAESVCIASVNEAGAKGLDAEIADVKQYLARHGVPIGKQIATMAKEREGDLLLDLAAQHNADLIVAGGYGRTRLSEWVFGGVTRHLLTACPVACLFSN